MFNSGAFDDFSTKTQRQDHVLYLKENAQMVFADSQKGLKLENDNLIQSTNINECMNHELSRFQNASRLAKLHFPDNPVPVGIFYKTNGLSFEFSKEEQPDLKNLEKLFRKGAYWSR